MYPPLSTKENACMDFLIITLHLNGMSSLINALNVIATASHGNSHS
jgi:heme/copper-type cytochrome/quinol oxidase subunit 1